MFPYESIKFIKSHYSLTNLVNTYQVGVEISDIQLKVTESQVEHLLGILAGNMGEPVTRADTKEIQMVADALTTVNFDARSWLVESEKKEEKLEEPRDMATYVKTQVQVELTQVSLEVFRGTGVDNSGRSSSVALFEMNNMGMLLTMSSDSSMKVSLRNILLCGCGRSELALSKCTTRSACSSLH